MALLLAHPVCPISCSQRNSAQPRVCSTCLTPAALDVVVVAAVVVVHVAVIVAAAVVVTASVAAFAVSPLPSCCMRGRREHQSRPLPLHKLSRLRGQTW